MLTTAFIWYKIQQKQYICEILLEFKISVFYFNVYVCSMYMYVMSNDSSEIILICWCGAQDTFGIIINVEERFCLLSG